MPIRLLNFYFNPAGRALLKRRSSTKNSSEKGALSKSYIDYSIASAVTSFSPKGFPATTFFDLK